MKLSNSENSFRNENAPRRLGHPGITRGEGGPRRTGRSGAVRRTESESCTRAQPGGVLGPLVRRRNGVAPSVYVRPEDCAPAFQPSAHCSPVRHVLTTPAQHPGAFMCVRSRNDEDPRKGSRCLSAAGSSRGDPWRDARMSLGAPSRCPKSAGRWPQRAANLVIQEDSARAFCRRIRSYS